MYLAVTIIHILVCFVLILVVLLQSGKAADLAGAFGGMGSQTAFGARGAATVLSKTTTICAVIFMLTSLGLAIMVMRYRGVASVLGQGTAAPTQPAKPGAPPPGQSVPMPVQLPKNMPAVPQGTKTIPVPVGGQQPQQQKK
jgi:preprotein translocase subunit SecG